MKTLLNLVLFFLLLITSGKVFAQSEALKWKPLIINDEQSVWYDDTSIDTLREEKVNVWVMQKYKPPLVFDGLRGKIYRSETKYAIDLKLNRYGILKVIYYNNKDKEIYNFNYHIDKYADELKYTFPAGGNSVLRELMSKIKKS